MPRVNHGEGIISQDSPVLEFERGNVDSTQTDEIPFDSDSDSDSDSVDVSPADNTGATADAPADRTGASSSQKEAETRRPAAQPSQSIEREPLSQPVSATPARGDDAPWIELQMQSPAQEKTTRKSKKASKKSSNKKSKDGTAAPIETATRRAVQTPPEQAPGIKASNEEAILSRLVKELEFGTLANSIALLNQLIVKCPDDPDYRSLLAMAIRLRDGDVWYDYSRKVASKEEIKETKRQSPIQIMKPTENETVNELKKSSWFLIRSVKR